MSRSPFHPMLAAAALASMLSSPALAVQTHVDFEGLDALQQVVYANYEVSGFRFSPNCHRDAPQNGPSGVWLGWDSASCHANNTPPYIESNPNWLGPPALSPNTNGGVGVGGWMYIDFAGQTFSLLSLDVMRGEAMTFLSSNGGNYLSPYTGSEAVNRTFSGPDWSHVQWLLISGGAAGTPTGIDNLVLEHALAVPEPASSLLLAAGGMALLIAARGRSLRASRRVAEGAGFEPAGGC